MAELMPKASSTQEKKNFAIFRKNRDFSENCAFITGKKCVFWETARFF